MRITLTGRRLALAAVLVVGAVTAPFAYATVAGGKAPPTGEAAATPLVLSSPSSTQAPASTADNPYQVSAEIAFNGSTQCGDFSLPANQDFVLESVTATGPFDSITVGPFMKASNGGVNFGRTEWTIALTGEHQKTRTFNLLVRPDSGAAASSGDVWGFGYCVNGPVNYLGWLLLTGQKVAGPTQAALTDFTARSGKAQTRLHWTTASETEILGFNVWRYRGAKGVKVNRTLVRAKRSGEPAGASYRYIDQVRGAKRGLTYRLQLVDLKGKRTWYAAFAIASK